MDNTPFLIERTLNASPERVWQAISNREHMKKWYFDLASFEPVPGFEFEFTAGEKGKEYLHKCRVVEVIPNKKLSYTWSYEGYTGNSLVTFELFPEGKQTRLRLTHEGLETFPASNPDLAKENFMRGWTEIIGNSLPAYLERN
jgi:uncharacterized protein YndB with AHSA1/START domain